MSPRNPKEELTTCTKCQNRILRIESWCLNGAVVCEVCAFEPTEQQPSKEMCRRYTWLPCADIQSERCSTCPKTKDRIPENRLRNTRAWAEARTGTLAGAEVIVKAIDELLERRAADEPCAGPVAYLVEFENGESELHPASDGEPAVGEIVTPLYARAAQPPSVPLTYETFWQRVRETGWNPSPDDLRKLLTEAEATLPGVVEGLREKLRVYGGHIPPCSGSPCDCGFKSIWDDLELGTPRLSSESEPKLISTVEMLREVEDTLIELGWHKDRGVLKRVTDCLDEVGRYSTATKGEGR